MARADQIYVMRPLMGMQGIYEHHGIDCGDGTVIHYRKGDEAVISRTSIASFAMGQPIYTKPQSVSFIPDVVIDRAESRMGERGYNLLTNNCEHFATWCKTGRNESEQLVTYGLDGAQLDTYTSRRLMEAAEEANPVRAATLFQQAMGNVSIAHANLQAQHQQALKEIDSWDRVAKAALQRDREDLARAALERKVQFKRQAAALKGQLEELNEIQAGLTRNRSRLQNVVS